MSSRCQPGLHALGLQRRHREPRPGSLNGIRHEHGLSTLIGSIALRNAARSHTSDMLKRGYFEHNSPNEGFGKRIRRYLDSPLVGENIAWGTGSYGTAKGIVGLWMRSPSHRHIILMSSLHRVGLGIATGSFRPPGSRRVVFTDAGWSSSVARRAHNPEVAGSNPAPATNVVAGQRPFPIGRGPLAMCGP